MKQLVSNMVQHKDTGMQYDNQPASVDQVSQSRGTHVVLKHACRVRTGFRYYASGRRMVIICSKDKGDKA